MPPADRRSLSQATALLRALDRAPHDLTLGLALAGAAGVGVIDWWTGPDLSLIVFYALPVLVVAAICAPRTAVLVAVAVALEWLAVAVLGPDSGASDLVLLWNAGVRLAFFLVVVWLVVGQRALLTALHRQATTDPLTGALNRRAFYEAAERELARSRRRREPVTVLYLDLDGLKSANDAVGHEAGDAMIAHVAGVARRVLRAEDLFCRAGGDEFIALLPAAGVDEGVAAARRLLAGFASRADGPPVRASVGAWTEVAPDAEIEVLVQHADRLMYLAKQAGGGDVASSTPQGRPDPA